MYIFMMKLQRAAFQRWTGTVKPGVHTIQSGFIHSVNCQIHQHSMNNVIKFRLISVRRINYPSIHHQIARYSNTAPLSYLSNSYHHGNKQPCILPHQSRRTLTRQSGSSDSSNPLLKLQPFVQQPILTDNELIFTPTEADIAKACQLFIPSAKHRIEFLKGAYYHEQAPDYQLPEIAFIGRSNVGKSSLIKAIFSNVRGLSVRTSKTPVGYAFSLVDMPGYGFNQPENFITSAEGFLKNRKNLRNTFLLIDSSVGLQSLDYVAIDMLEEFSIPYIVVLTKSDKASKRQLIESTMTVSKVIREHTQCCLPQPFLVSAKSGSGLSFLKCFIAYTTDNLQLQET